MIKIALTFALPALVRSQAWLTLDQAMPCLINPITTVQAGQTLDFQLFNAQNSSCEATFTYMNASFLPVSWNVAPRDCAGDQIASFNVPCNSPNGPVAIEWQCTGHKAMSCAMLNITGGASNYERLMEELFVPTVGCHNVSTIQKSIVTTWSSAAPPATQFLTSSCISG